MTLKALRIKVRAAPLCWKKVGFRLNVCPPDFQRVFNCHAPYPPHLRNRGEIHAFPLHWLVVRIHEVTRKMIWKLRILFLIIASAITWELVRNAGPQAHPRLPKSKSTF